MPDLESGIHDLPSRGNKVVDGRVKLGHDDENGMVEREFYSLYF